MVDLKEGIEDVLNERLRGLALKMRLYQCTAAAEHLPILHLGLVAALAFFKARRSGLGMS